jgi:Flp pilus assembly pilin Flp
MGLFSTLMMRRIHELVTGDDGQDLIEYTLLLAFVMFTIIGLTAGFSASIRGIVSVSNSQISAANTMVS